MPSRISIMRCAALPLAVLVTLFPFAARTQGGATITGRVSAADGAVIVGAFILVDSAGQPAAQTGVDGR